MSETLKKFNKIIPIGYICSLSGLLIKLGKRDSATAFEHMACPMWAVNELVANNFTGFLNDTRKQRVFEDSPEEYIVDQQYYIRLLTKGTPINALQARAANFLPLLASAAEHNQTVLFLRWAEPATYVGKGARVGVEAFVAKYQKTEAEYALELSTMLRQLFPTLQFKVLLLSGNSVDTSHAVSDHVVVLPEPTTFTYQSPTVVKDLDLHLQEHHSILAEFL